jgi:hypothetical protein
MSMAATDEIRHLLEAKAEALVARRADDLGALIHGDFVYVNAAARRFDKAGYIETYCASGRISFVQQRFGDLAVQRIDDFAVATLSIQDEFRMGERRISGRYRSLSVFARSSGRWLWAAGQTMPDGAP